MQMGSSKGNVVLGVKEVQTVGNLKNDWRIGHLRSVVVRRKDEGFQKVLEYLPAGSTVI